ncbi:MAG: MarR family transcriptional regulator [Rhodospirillales bacterium]|jgi:DNA-binding MarR family transcriptional regulator|nr:MarR family transcriptional regulator [Rhodospirillales bacterium]MDP7099762.1 MarR family transcriptional regulator [Rhodospirillales bacterium]MDP7424082.1 MarR family transcriptional regulator [Rhodospirillales bacterium]MDP7623349.1 MarR family transcriptional regulator [Rhodospirillales bacterium]HJO87430.1 MarR family transcriptional regulator [Rhodospirillales bacterium]|tara:strand:+ start:6566 stop:7051 length:486 start_codon:yes stop_codon:yes gene_type:complete
MIKTKTLDQLPVRSADDDLNYGKLPAYLGYQARQAQAAVWRDFPRLMEKIDVTPGEFGLLTLIAANPGINQMCLARVYKLDKSTLSYATNRLVKRRLIKRRRDVSDRRHYTLSLTPTGQAKLAAATAKVEEQEQIMDRMLEPGERELLLSLLKKIPLAFEE